MLRRVALALVVTSALGVAPSRALAQSSKAQIAEARSLAQDAGDLLDQKNYAEALERATQAEALYHATIHVLMIAQAQEGLGRLAESALTYERLVAEPLPRTAPGVFRDAQEKGKVKLRELLARVPSML